MTLRMDSGWRRAATTLVAAALVLAWPVVSGAQTPPVADFGDAPDDDLACEANGLVPAKYPTQWGTSNAFPGRTAPFHKPPTPGVSNAFLGDPPTYEPLPPGAFEPQCDWLSGIAAPPPPPCDQDNGPVVLCLSPTCLTGIVVGPGGTCDEVAAGAFGPPVAPPVMGFWVFEVGRSPGAARSGVLANVAVDVSLDGVYGDAGEWVLKDEPVTAAPGSSQFLVTAPFPATTYESPCTPPTILGWCLTPFWTRFHVSDEALVPLFEGAGVNWDGSGRAGGYDGFETEDWVAESDPKLVPWPDCNLNGVPDRVDEIFDRLHDRNGDGRYDECSPRELMPGLQVVPSAVDFGRVPVGGASQQVVILSALGQMDVEIVALSLVGADTQAFRVLSDPPPFLIPYRRPRQLVVMFTPSTAGPQRATLAIQAHDLPLIHVPLAGIGEGTRMAGKAGAQR